MDRNAISAPRLTMRLSVATREGGVDRNGPITDSPKAPTRVATREGGVDRNFALLNALIGVHRPVATREGGVDRNFA